MLEAGSRAPAVSLHEFDGSERALKDLTAGGPVLLAFFKASCPVCQLTLPFLERLHRAGNGVRITGVSQDGAAATREFSSEFGLTFPMLLDRADGYPASNAFGIVAVPSLFLIEPDGTVTAAWAGFSKREMERLGARTGSQPFLAGERIPEYKPG